MSLLDKIFRRKSKTEPVEESTPEIGDYEWLIQSQVSTHPGTLDQDTSGMITWPDRKAFEEDVDKSISRTREAPQNDLGYKWSR